MKKIFFFLLVAFGLMTNLRAQNITTTVVTPPCNANGVIRINIPASAGLVPPYTVTYSFNHNPSITHTVTSGLTDQLTNYDGFAVSIFVSDNQGHSNYGNIQPMVPFTFGTTATNAVCPNLGTASVLNCTGVAPLTYSWRDYNRAGVVSTNAVLNAPEGFYYCVVTDARGCTSRGGNGYYLDSAAIFSQSPITAQIATTNAICPAKGSATVSAPTGGTAPYTYRWSTGATTTTINNLAGNQYYYVTVTSANGCTRVLYPYVYYQSNVSVTTTAVQPNCPVKGSATATVTGGVAPYTYVWSNGAGTATASNLADNANYYYSPYTVTVYDAQGCTGSREVQLRDTFNIRFISTITPANCTTGAISLTNFSGGTAPYSFEWDNGATSASVTNLTVGIHNVTITDGNGCRYPSPRYFSITQSPIINVNVNSTPATCLNHDGGATAFGSQGAAPYTYIWNNGANSQGVTDLGSGNYNVTATDANGCTGIGYTAISATTPIYVTYTSTPSSCTAATGTATLTLNGGTAPYTIDWSTFPIGHTATATGLAPGTYYFSVHDAVGCVQSGSVQINPIATVSIYSTQVSATCIASNGRILTTAIGGTAPYTYLWNTGATTSGLTNKPAGQYSVVVKDANGCSGYTYAYIDQTTPITIGMTTVPATCQYSANGSVAARPVGGTAPYIYAWSNGSTAASQSNVLTGSYYVSVRDANGCTANDYAFVANNETSAACYATISGKVYNDVNTNCVINTTEVGIPNVMIHCGTSGYTFTDANGNYSFRVPAGTYAMQEVVQFLYPLAACQTNPVNIIAAAGSAYVANFANTVRVIHDVKIDTWSITPPRPGFPYQQQVIVSNQGTVAETDIYAGFRQDAQLTAAVVGSPEYLTLRSPNFFNTNTTASPAIALTPGQTAAITLDYTVPANMPLNTLLTFKDTTAQGLPVVTNWLADYTPWDNVNYYTVSTVGSYDPNFKEVSPRGIGATGIIEKADTVLNYAVHFQNIGTYEAQNVVVIDSLNTNLDFKSLKPTYKSHNCKINVSESGIIKFDFKNIHLPAKSQNEPASNGMVTYSIHLKKNLPQGTIIRNRAAIYFDFNQPIITNGTINTTRVNVSTEEEAAELINHFALYPNPTSGDINAVVESTSDESQNVDIFVFDVLGQRVATQTAVLQRGEQTIALNTAQLAAGVYFATIVNKQGNGAGTKTVSQKFVKVN